MSFECAQHYSLFISIFMRLSAGIHKTTNEYKVHRYRILAVLTFFFVLKKKTLSQVYHLLKHCVGTDKKETLMANYKNMLYKQTTKLSALWSIGNKNANQIEMHVKMTLKSVARKRKAFNDKEEKKFRNVFYLRLEHSLEQQSNFVFWQDRPVPVSMQLDEFRLLF